jgi:aspartate dehydrogenase
VSLRTATSRAENSPPANAIGIVGLGTIGRRLLALAREEAARAVPPGLAPVTIAGVASRDAAKARAYLETIPDPPPYLDIDELTARVSLLVEAAGQSAVPDLAGHAFAAGRGLMVISCGALLDRPELLEQARAKGCRLIVPSGAIAGLDGIKSACQGAVERVTMITRKSPQSLAGAPYLDGNGISLDGLTGEREVFSGSAREACRGFPANVNVSAAVSLAGIGPDRTRVRILAVPGLQHNCHDVEVIGEFGELRISIRNVPTENPRTGRLTALSIWRTIRQALDPVHVGT